MELSRFIQIARGDAPADLVLKGGKVVNVFSGEVYEADVAIADGHIVGLGTYAAQETIDVSGKFLAPGFIDAHVHIESSMVPPPQFARAVVPRGTTTVVIDPHEIGNVLGLDGIRYMFDTAKYNPLSIFVMMPSCVPATGMETAGAVLHWYDIAPYQNDPWVLGLAEMMNFPGVVHGAEDVLDKLRAFEKSVRDGHAPGLRGHTLNAYVAAGIGSDHESTTVEEAREKLRLGMVVFIREATNARNLETLLPLITPANVRRICWCTDDRQPADLLDQGHIDYLIRRAIALGLDPITAIRIGTLNPAEYFRLHDRGAIAPG
ncbi:MAG TPA: amidohydrolase family protein, partial [Anaerolineae bacterium]